MNGHENIDPNIFVKIKTGKITTGHDFTLVKGQSRLDVRKYSFPIGYKFFSNTQVCKLHLPFKVGLLSASFHEQMCSLVSYISNEVNMGSQKLALNNENSL